MNSLQAATMLLSSASGDGRVFLGEDIVGWRTALIAAVIAAVAYELVMATTRRITLRLPFLVLYLARLTVPQKEWRRLHREWAAELHHILRDHEIRGITRLLNGLRYAVPLALGGAHNTVKAENTSRRSLARQALSDNKPSIMLRSCAQCGHAEEPHRFLNPSEARWLRQYRIRDNVDGFMVCRSCRNIRTYFTEKPFRYPVILPE